MNIEGAPIEHLIKEIVRRCENKGETKNINHISIKIENNIKDDLMLFTVSEVAKRLKVNKSTVYELIKQGHLKGLKLGSMKVTAAELEKFLTANNGKDFDNINIEAKTILKE